MGDFFFFFGNTGCPVEFKNVKKKSCGPLKSIKTTTWIYDDTLQSLNNEGGVNLFHVCEAEFS